MRKFLKYSGWGLLALLVVVTFVFLFKKSQKKPVEYNILNVEQTEAIEKKTIITGSIVPRDEVSIVPQISGIVEEIFCKPGQEVKAGDVIARLSVVPSAMELSQAQARLEQAQISFGYAKDKYDRDNELYQKGVVPKEEFQTSELNYNKAKKEVEEATNALSIVRTGASRHGSKSSSTMVRATVSGVILDIPVRVGNSVIQANSFNAGTTIATIANMQNLLFRGQIDEIEVGKLRQNMPVKIIIGALNQLQLSAKIEYISPKAKTEGGSNLFDVEAAIDLNKDNRIRAGMSANAEAVTEAVYNVLAVPEAALEFVSDSVFVYKVLAEKPKLNVQRIPVTVGVSNGVMVEIKSGLRLNEKVRGGEKVQK